jgi:hypothetical protein
MAQRLQVHSDTFLSSEFHHRNEIGISRYEDDGIDDSLYGQPGDIESDPHVYALLAHVWDEVSGSDLPSSPSKRSKGSPSEFPARHRQDPATHSEIWLKFQGLQQSLVLPSLRCSREVEHGVVNGVCGRTLKWRRIVEVDAEKGHPHQLRLRHRCRAQGNYIVNSGEPAMGFFQLLLDEPTVHQHRGFFRHLSAPHTKIKDPAATRGLSPTWIMGVAAGPILHLHGRAICNKRQELFGLTILTRVLHFRLLELM